MPKTQRKYDFSVQKTWVSLGDSSVEQASRLMKAQPFIDT
jgi:hypothetical protein